MTQKLRLRGTFSSAKVQHPGRRSDSPCERVFTRASGLAPGHTGTKRQLLGGQSVPARPSEHAQDVSFRGWKAQSPSRSRRWAVSEKSGNRFFRRPSSEADTLSVSIINPAASQISFVSYLTSVIWKKSLLFSNFFARRPNVRRRRRLCLSNIGDKLLLVADEETRL